MYMTDGKKTVKIEMIGVNDMDFAEDFFETGDLERKEIEVNGATETASVVEDVDYCIESAHDAENHEGDFRDYEDNIKVYIETI